MRISCHERIDELDTERWNSVTGTDYPFLRHEMLWALEASGAVAPATGWTPQHVSVWEGDRLQAVMPLYLKSHSFGEYVFDFAWADAYRRYGLAYYPKLVTAVPFTPATGPRLAVAEGVDRARVEAEVLAFIERHAEALGASSWHCLFPEAEAAERWQARGLLQREDCQFHWLDYGFGDFDGFLGALRSKKRKNIRRERRLVAEQGFEVRRVPGEAIDETLWRRFYAFYRDTYLKHGQQGYLNLDCFLKLGEWLAEHLVMVVAERAGAVEAAALLFRDGDTLYGRYWGTAEDWDCLHFECCFYQGIEHCLAHGLSRFDPGAQGEHKLLRGFWPVTTRSLHWLADQRFRAPVADFCRQEAEAAARYRAMAAEHLPYREDWLASVDRPE